MVAGVAVDRQRGEEVVPPQIFLRKIKWVNGQDVIWNFFPHWNLSHDQNLLFA